MILLALVVLGLAVLLTWTISADRNVPGASELEYAAGSKRSRTVDSVCGRRYVP